MTYTTFSSKQLGGLVVEQDTGYGLHIGVMRANGTAVVYWQPVGGKRTVSSTGQKAVTWVRKLFAQARATA